MPAKPNQEERLAAANKTLTAAIATVSTTEDWQDLPRISQSFHRYSPNNQLLLVAQGADELSTSFDTCKQIPGWTATCPESQGETALRVYAPTRTHRCDPSTFLEEVPQSGAGAGRAIQQLRA